jgi:hypothetical protein
MPPLQTHRFTVTLHYSHRPPKELALSSIRSEQGSLVLAHAPQLSEFFQLSDFPPEAQMQIAIGTDPSSNPIQFIARWTSAALEPIDCDATRSDIYIERIRLSGVSYVRLPSPPTGTTID